MKFKIRDIVMVTGDAPEPIEALDWKFVIVKRKFGWFFRSNYYTLVNMGSGRQYSNNSMDNIEEHFHTVGRLSRKEYKFLKDLWDLK